MKCFRGTRRFTRFKSLDSSSTVNEKATSQKVAIPGKDADFGSSATVKTFYEDPGSDSDSPDWTETPPKQLNKKVAKAQDRVAIKIFKVEDPTKETIAGSVPLKTQKIEIQSSILVEALKDIVKDEDVFLDTSDTAKFEEPFKPLFFCYDKIVSLSKNTADGVLRQHLELLVQVLDDLFGSFMAKLKSLRSSGLVSYSLAWTYFPRKTLVYAASPDCARVCRVIKTSYDKGVQDGNKLELNCEEIAFDGHEFSWRPIDLHINSFTGNLPVTSLQNYPLEFHDGKEEIRERLSARAKKVLEYQDLKYCDYDGIGLEVHGDKLKKHNVRLINFREHELHV